MKRTVLAASTVVLYAAHQDVWLWRSAEPLIFGVLPPGLAYHVLYTLATSVPMWLLVRHAWPSHLEEEVERRERER